MKKTYISTSTTSMVTKLCRVVTYGGWTASTNSHDHVTNEKPYDCICAIPIASKFGREVT